MPLYHADLYRLERAAVEDLGIEEIGARDGVLAIDDAGDAEREDGGGECDELFHGGSFAGLEVGCGSH